jgi:ureidoglycolate hydrolase
VETFARSIEARPLDAGAWAEFGWLPVSDTDPGDGQNRLAFEWSDVHVNLIGHALDEVPRTGRGPVCQMMFRHLTHTQALLVLNCIAVMVVAPPHAAFESPADAGKLRAFVLKPLDSFVLHRGTWHWGPFPVREPRVEMYNIQGLRYAQDNECVRLDAAGASVEVLPPA